MCPQEIQRVLSRITTRVLVASVLLIMLISAAKADQTTIPDYDAARPLFWSQLYPGGGFTLYCAQQFVRNIGLDIERRTTAHNCRVDVRFGS